MFLYQILTSTLPDGLNSVSDIQDYFEFIITKREIITDNLPAKIYVKK